MKRTLSFVALLLLLVFLTGAYLATTVPEDDALIQPMGDALDKELSQTLNTIAENKEFAGFEELTQDTDLRNYLNTRIFEKASRSIRIDTGLFTSGIYINNAASDCIVKGIAGHVIIKDMLPVAARVIVNETLSSDIPDETDHRRLLSSWISQAINNLTADAVKAYPPELQVMMSGFVEQVKAENISMGSRAINNILKFETGNGYSMLYGSGKDGKKEVMSLGIAGRIYETPALKKVKSETEFHFKKLISNKADNDSLFTYKSENLKWSAVFADLDWDAAVAHCKNIGGRLPTISELRTLIQNCPATETGGVCKVTNECLHWGNCRSNDCNGCKYFEDGRYSKLGDTGRFWSSSELSDRTDHAYNVGFPAGIVLGSLKNETSNFGFRCVK